mgnify:CR=1 FL=1
MTPEQRSLISMLIGGPGPEKPIATDEFLRRIGESDGSELGLELLRDAVERRDADDVFYSMVLPAVFGLKPEYLDLLLELEHADWHYRHEDVVSLLADFRSPSTIDALYHATQWVPEYLDYDDARALAVKAIWGLGAIRGDEAAGVLQRLLDSEVEVIRENAAHQLARRAFIDNA